MLLLCLPLTGMAKDKKDNSDPKYLAGAVTTIDGKVAFTNEINAPGLSKTEIFNQMLEWAKGRFKPDGMRKKEPLQRLPKSIWFSLLQLCHWTVRVFIISF